MTVAVTAAIGCDAVQCTRLPITMKRRNEGGLTLTSIRRFARIKYGWQHRAGKDYCADHAEYYGPIGSPNRVR